MNFPMPLEKLKGVEYVDNRTGNIVPQDILKDDSSN